MTPLKQYVMNKNKSRKTVKTNKRTKKDTCEKTKVGRNNIGITLVALVVTIVVFLILARITIIYIMRNNSVFKQAEDAELKTEIAKYQEMLETAKNQVIIEGLGKFNPNRYFEYIEDQEII